MNLSLSLPCWYIIQCMLHCLTCFVLHLHSYNPKIINIHITQIWVYHIHQQMHPNPNPLLSLTHQRQPQQSKEKNWGYSQKIINQHINQINQSKISTWINHICPIVSLHHCCCVSNFRIHVNMKTPLNLKQAINSILMKNNLLSIIITTG